MAGREVVVADSSPTVIDSSVFPSPVVVIEPSRLPFYTYKSQGGKLDGLDFNRAQAFLGYDGQSPDIGEIKIGASCKIYSKGLFQRLAANFGLPSLSDDVIALCTYFRECFHIPINRAPVVEPTTKTDELMDHELLKECYLLTGDVDSFKKIPPAAKQGNVSTYSTHNIDTQAGDIFMLRQLLSK